MREKDCPECRWVAVVDASGRRRMEPRWAMPTPPVTQPVSKAA